MVEPAPEEVTPKAAKEPPAPVFVDGEQAVERIRALVETARAAWFVLLGYLAFVGTTLLGVYDIDFFAATASTQLPLVGISIPTMTFFWTAPILGAALHIYLHLYLVKLWDALAEAPPTIGMAPLGDRVSPWLVVDWALRLRSDQAIEPRPLDWLGNWVMAGLIWLAGPIVLGFFWLQSATARDPLLTLQIAAVFGVSLYASFCGWRQAWARLQHAGRTPPPLPRWRILLWRWGVLPVVVVLMVVTSWLRTEGGLDYYADRVVAASTLTFESKRDDKGNRISEEEVREEWVRERFPTLASVSQLHSYDDRINRLANTPLARIDLTGAEISKRPTDWVGRETAERRFRVDWCADNGLPPDACAPLRLGSYQNEAREAWCQERKISDCVMTFGRLDEAFDREWAEQRREYLINIVRPDLSWRDLRFATMTGAFLAGIDLTRARLVAADLRWAQLEEAKLYGARLEEAILLGAQLEAADLSHARLDGAELMEAQLEAADLSNARLEGARLLYARLERANLSNANLQGAVLHFAQLNGANLRNAKLAGVSLETVGLQSVDWRGAQLGSSLAHGANFADGENLTQRQLAGVIGNNHTVLPLDAETDEQLYVCSCWNKPPATLGRLLWNSLFTDTEWLRAQWLCSPGEQPRAVGRSAETGETVADRGQCEAAVSE